VKNYSQSLSRPAYVSSLVLTLVLSFACLAAHNNQFAAAAQSAGAGSCTPVPTATLRRPRLPQFESVEAGLKDRLAQANHDYESAKLRCKGDPTPRACMDAAQKNFQNAETSIQKSRTKMTPIARRPRSTPGQRGTNVV